MGNDIYVMQRQIEDVKALCEEHIRNDGTFGKNRYTDYIHPEEIANVFGWKIVKSVIGNEYELREVQE